MTTQTADKPFKEAAPVKHCLSGSGKVVLGRKSNFAMGGDAQLKSKLIKEVIEGKKDSTISNEAREYAKNAWPKLHSELAAGTHDQVQRARRKQEAASAEAPKAKTK